MNERIKELMKEANKDITLGKPFWSALEEFSEKFAELIIRECIQIGGPEDSYTDEWFEAKADSVAKIKKHFGVEE
jgi:hypothetical protein